MIIIYFKVSYTSIIIVTVVTIIYHYCIIIIRAIITIIKTIMITRAITISRSMNTEITFREFQDAEGRSRELVIAPKRHFLKKQMGSPITTPLPICIVTSREC